MGANEDNLPIGGGGPQKAVLKKIAAAHRELATLYTALANLSTGGVRATRPKTPVSKSKS
jgi:hypothetical protein